MSEPALARFRSFLRHHIQSVLTLISVVCAVTTGLTLRQRTEPWTKREVGHENVNKLSYCRKSCL